MSRKQPFDKDSAPDPQAPRKTDSHDAHLETRLMRLEERLSLSESCNAGLEAHKEHNATKKDIESIKVWVLWGVGGALLTVLLSILSAWLRGWFHTH